MRQVEVKFFLDHWTSIRASEAMRNVWQQIRVGRHPGFEEGMQSPPFSPLFAKIYLQSGRSLRRTWSSTRKAQPLQRIRRRTEALFIYLRSSLHIYPYTYALIYPSANQSTI